MLVGMDPMTPEDQAGCLFELRRDPENRRFINIRIRMCVGDEEAAAAILATDIANAREAAARQELTDAVRVDDDGYRLRGRLAMQSLATFAISFASVRPPAERDRIGQMTREQLADVGIELPTENEL